MCLSSFCFFLVDNTENRTKLIEFIIRHRREIINNYILVSYQFPHCNITYHSVIGTYMFINSNFHKKKLRYFKNSIYQLFFDSVHSVVYRTIFNIIIVISNRLNIVEVCSGRQFPALKF